MFERYHGAGYKALILVDNSQGHSAYAEDVLLATQMNLRPGGKQACLKDGWFMHNGKKVMQQMIFPPDHPNFPNQPKGMKQVLVKQGLWRDGLLMQCKPKCLLGAKNCCAKQILELQPDFEAQKSLVQEVIEAAGHCCIFLPKFHCKLNFIEIFWGAVKRHLHKNCDYTFAMLKKNMPKALRSVDVSTIWKWEHHMY